MALKLNQKAYEHAKELIQAGKVVRDGREAWNNHEPSAQKEDEFIRAHGLEEYGKWFLAVDDKKPADTKAYYKFPCGDFEQIHLGGLLAAQNRAGRHKYFDIETAASHLHGMIEIAKHA